MKKYLSIFGIIFLFACEEQSVPPDPELTKYCIILTDISGNITGTGACSNSVSDDEWKRSGNTFAPQPAYPNPTKGNITIPVFTSGLDSLDIYIQKVPISNPTLYLSNRLYKRASGKFEVPLILDSLRLKWGRGIYRVNFDAYADSKKFTSYGSVQVD